MRKKFIAIIAVLMTFVLNITVFAAEKNNTYLVNTLSNAKTDDTIIDIAYESMMEQENYIVNLINEHSSKQTSIK